MQVQLELRARGFRRNMTVTTLQNALRKMYFDLDVGRSICFKHTNLKLEPAVEPVHPAVAIHVQRGVELRRDPPFIVIAAGEGRGWDGGFMAVSWRFRDGDGRTCGKGSRNESNVEKHLQLWCRLTVSVCARADRDPWASGETETQTLSNICPGGMHASVKSPRL